MAATSQLRIKSKIASIAIKLRGSLTSWQVIYSVSLLTLYLYFARLNFISIILIKENYDEYFK